MCFSNSHKIHFRISDDEFFIEYRTKQHEIIKRRIWPKDAGEFVWLSPFIISPFDSSGYKDVQEIRFTNTNQVIHSGKLELQFKNLKFDSPETTDNYSNLYKWFNP